MAGTHRRLLELIVFVAVLPVIGWYGFPEDPLALRSGFPWPILPPVLFAARYGTLWGTACAAAALTSFALVSPAYTADMPLLVSSAIGMFVMTTLVGELTSGRRRRTADAEARHRLLEQRLDAFATDYHVLKVSHGQLEEWLAGQRFSLRQALQRLRDSLGGAGGLQAAAGHELLTLLSQFCQLHVAALHVATGGTTIAAEPVARLGDMPPLSVFDPLLQQALRSRRLVSVDPEHLASQRGETALLAALPIIDSRDRLHAVLVVGDMPFLAFQEENLNLLALLGQQTGNLLAQPRDTTDPVARRSRFMIAVDEAIGMARLSDAKSLLLGFAFSPSDTDETDAVIAPLLIDELRSLDSGFRTRADDGSTCLFVLLPLAGVAEGERYVARAERVVIERTERDLADRLDRRASLSIDRHCDRAAVETFMDELVEMSTASSGERVPARFAGREARG